MSRRTPDSLLTLPDYRRLADFRLQLRRFLVFSEEAAAAAGLAPQQHQVLLALKGLPEGAAPNIRTLAERLCLRHHTLVELVDRLERKRLVTRSRSAEDRREVRLKVTRLGDAVLRRLSAAHRAELRTLGPELSRTLNALLQKRSATGARA